VTVVFVRYMYYLLTYLYLLTYAFNHGRRQVGYIGNDSKMFSSYVIYDLRLTLNPTLSCSIYRIPATPVISVAVFNDMNRPLFDGKSTEAAFCAVRKSFRCC